MKVTGRVVVTAADRIQHLPAPFLTELEGLKRSVLRHGKQITDLGRYAIAVDPEPHTNGATDVGSIDIKRVFGEFLAREYHVNIDPEREMLLLAGARASLLLLGAYFLERGTICYVPDPGYDAYRKLAILFDGDLKSYPVYQRNDYLPNLEQFDGKPSKGLKLLFVNSPHNPTGAVADQDFYQRVQKLAAERNILVIVDSSYAPAHAGNFRPPLFCESTNRLRVGLELFSFSAGLCAPDLRLTALVGRKALIEPLAALSHSLGSAPYRPSLDYARSYFASAETLVNHIARCREEIGARMAVITDVLKNASIEFYPNIGAGFVWVKLRRGRQSISFARGLLRHKGVLVAPGSAFGEEGEGWVRIAANVGGEKLREALDSFARHYRPIKSRLKRRHQ